MRPYVIGLLIVMIIAQWAVPVNMIIEHETVLGRGKTYKFKTAPIDPSDPFRGSYLTLRFEATQYTVDSSITYKKDPRVFVRLGTDESGFAFVRGISPLVPPEGDYIIAKIGYESPNWDQVEKRKTNKKTVEILFPFDRFYLEESKAKGADRAYQESSRDKSQVAYAIVKVSNGKAALEDVILNGQSVRDIVARENEK